MDEDGGALRRAGVSAARATIGRGGWKILSVVEWADHVGAAAISPVRSSPSALNLRLPVSRRVTSL
jgi:hypothetical protein